jgi:hypothetical protein
MIIVSLSELGPRYFILSAWEEQKSCFFFPFTIYFSFTCAPFAHGPWTEKDNRMDAHLSCKWLISSLGYDTGTV